MQSKYSHCRFENRYSEIGKHLYQSDWIPGYNISFMAQSLIKEKIFYETLSIFIDPLLLSVYDDLNQNIS